MIGAKDASAVEARVRLKRKTGLHGFIKIEILCHAKYEVIEGLGLDLFGKNRQECEEQGLIYILNNIIQHITSL